MARTVTILPQTINRQTAAPIGSMVKRKVAAYARVSTDHEEQQSSYEAQCDYYTKFIKARDDWEFAGIYSDDGVSATSTRHREGFQQMVADALAGKINLIVTKSVSRFARNTVDSLTTIRTLKEHGTEVFFEKESIWTFDAKGEMLLTILSSLSQEESRSISENVKWGQRKKFSDGRFSVSYGRFLGYEKGEDGTMVINREQAGIVEQIYSDFILGLSPKAIAKKLTEAGVPTPGGQAKWYEGTVRSILKNEKYMGCALLQKTYTPDFLTKKAVRNKGEVPQYYVEDSHPAIIPPDQFRLVQSIFEERARVPKHSGATIFSGKIRCGCCGGWYGSKVWHSTDKYRRVIWQCNAKFRNKEKCDTPHLTEDDIKAAFVSVANRVITMRDDFITELHAIQDKLSDTIELEKEKRILDGQMLIDATAFNDLVAQNARVAQNQSEYREREAALKARYEETEAKRNAVMEQIKIKQARRARIVHFVRTVEGLPEMFTEFDPEVWAGLVDNLTVYSKDHIVFRLNGGMEVEA